MKRYENDCCDCSYPCPPGGCQLKHNPHWYCDRCGDEFPPYRLYDIDGDMMCADCAAENISYEELLEELYGTVRE